MLLHPTSSTPSCPTLRTVRLGRTLTLAALVALGAMACEKVPLMAPSGTVITLVASTTVLPINGSADLVAVLIENGTSTGQTAAGTPVHNGTLVTFTTSLGRIEPAEARTINGRVSVALVADGRSGTATVSAFSGSATQKLDIKIGAAAAERVAVTASPSSVQANGGTSTISARVEDASGNPVTGVPVTFTTTAGTLSTQSALTNDSGFATTYLSTTTEAVVTASSGGKIGTATVKVRSRSKIKLTIAATSVFVGAPASFTVEPDAAVALTGATIDFGDGHSQPLGAISSATAVVHFYTDDGVFQVNVSATDVDGGTAEATGSVGVTPFTIAASSKETTGAKNTIFTFTVSGLPTTVPIDHFVWNFGDGVVQTLFTASTTHAYATIGIKTITVTVYPLYGSSKTATFQVLVTEPS